MLNKLNCVVENLKLNDSACSTYILFGISNKNSYFDYIYSDNICKYIPKTSFNTIKFRITTLSSLNNAYNTINGFLLVFNIIFLQDLDTLLSGEELYLETPTGFLAPFFTAFVTIYLALNAIKNKLVSNKLRYII